MKARKRPVILESAGIPDGLVTYAIWQELRRKAARLLAELARIAEPAESTE